MSHGNHCHVAEALCRKVKVSRLCMLTYVMLSIPNALRCHLPLMLMAATDL